MKKEDLAKNYSKEKSLEFQAFIEEAYKAGFEAGVESVSDQSCTVKNVEYIDLKLPSGTLWSSCSCDLIFSDAIVKNIPTKEQWEELEKYCVFKKHPQYARYEITSHNGKKIWLMGCTNLLTWIPQGTDVKKTKEALRISKLFNETDFNNSTESVFAGEPLPIFLVIKK